MDKQPLEIPINDRIKAFETEFMALLNQHQLTYSIVIDFPNYKIWPDEVKLALIILQKHNVSYQLGYLDKKETKDEN